jgi:ribosomal protein L17
MMIESLFPAVSGVEVKTTHNRGFTPEEVAQRCVEKIISVGDKSHPAIREQAYAFKEYIEAVVTFYIKDAVQNDRHTIATRLTNAGYPELTILLEK